MESSARVARGCSSAAGGVDAVFGADPQQALGPAGCAGGNG